MSDVGTAAGPAGDDAYFLRISRLTVDKLGVKLYDKVSAVVAELVANSYDADATKVTVELPMGTQLASKDDQGTLVDAGYTVTVSDNGHGMTPGEARSHYLQVGRDRRTHVEQGATSRELARPVMGRKGIGKLAPFGICGCIEVRSAGGDATDEGYLTTHFFLDFDKIVEDTDAPVELGKGPDDGTWSAESGTTIRLTRFKPKRVPAKHVFMRQLARRFALAAQGFTVTVLDLRPGDGDENPVTMQPFAVETVDSTRIDLSTRPVPHGDEELPVTGWIGMAQESYRDDEMAGVRIYARGKIVATTRDFEQPAGFTGEFTIRSYLVGEVHAEWLDADLGEDLVRTDRQEILWESDLGQAMRQWGADLIKEMGAAMRQPRRDRVRRSFIKISKMKERATAAYQDASVVDAAMDLAKRFGALADEGELEDEVYIDELAEIILAVAPHQALMSAFREFSGRTGGEDQLGGLLDLFGKTRVAEMASYAQIAARRVKVLGELDEIVFDTDKDEAALQRIIADAPWLIQPDWSVITANQSLKTFKRQFEEFWKKRTGEEVVLAITYGTKRPDFVLVSSGSRLHLVEIKAADHKFDDADFDRLYNYVDAMTDFFEANKDMREEYGRSWQIDLIADGVDLKVAKNKRLYDELIASKEVVRSSWQDFQARARRANEQFLDARDEAAEEARKASTLPTALAPTPPALATQAKPATTTPATAATPAAGAEPPMAT